MSRPKEAKPASPPQSKPKAAIVNGPAGEVLTLAEAAAYLRLSEADVLRLVDEQGLPARRLANEWRFLKAAIQQWLSTPPPRYSKEDQLAVAGSWKDDPYVEEELKEALKRRRRPASEPPTFATRRR